MLLVLCFAFASVDMAFAKGKDAEEIILAKNYDMQHADAVRQLFKEYQQNPYMFGVDDYSSDSDLKSNCKKLEFLKLVQMVKGKTLDQYPSWENKRVSYTLKVGSRTMRSSVVIRDGTQKVQKAIKACESVNLNGYLPMIHVSKFSEVRDLDMISKMKDSIGQASMRCMMKNSSGCSDAGGGTQVCSASQMLDSQIEMDGECGCKSFNSKNYELRSLVSDVTKKYPKWRGAILHYIQSPHDFEAANVFVNIPMVNYMAQKDRCK